MPEQAKDIFLAAIQKPAPERDVWINDACAGNPDLRQRVTQLLGAHAAEDSFLEQPAVQAAELSPDLLAERHALGTLGDFRIVREIGRGGMGVVYEAEQISLKRRVALKVLPFAAVLDNRQFQRFRTEAMAAARLHHQHIVPVYQVGCDRATHFYAMQYIDGRNVAELIRETRQMAGIALPEEPGPTGSHTETPASAPQRAIETAKLADITTDYSGNRLSFQRKIVELGVQAAQALEFAHQHGILHRDIKPSNLMLDSAGVLWVTDFGLARIEGDEGLTMSGDLLGTLRYMSPEQALGKRVVIDQRTDIYSLGVSLYEMLTLKPVYNGSDRAELLRQISFELPTPLRKHDPSIPADLETIVQMAMAREPHRRYETAQELADDLQRFLDNKPILARRPSRTERVQKWVARNKPLTASMALVLAAAVFLGYATFLIGQHRTSQPEEQSDPGSGKPTVAANDAGPDAATSSSVSNPPAGVSQSQEPQELAGNTSDPLKAIVSPVANAEVPENLARPDELVGLVPEPPLIPDVGRWQLVTKQPRSVMRSGTWSPDEQQIAVAEANNVRIYDGLDSRLLHVLIAHSQPVTSVAWHPGGKRLASSSEDGTVRLWSSAGVPTHVLQGHTGPVYQVAWRSDGTQLASASADGTVRIWSADGGLIRTLDDRGRHVFAIDWAPQGSELASVGGDIRPAPAGDQTDNSVCLWDADTGNELWRNKPLVIYPGLCVDWRPDGQQLAVGFGHVYRSTHWINHALPNAGVRIWNRDGTTGLVIGRDAGSVRAVAWQPEGRQIAFGGRDGQVNLWNAHDGKATGVLVNHSIDLFSICWNRKGTKVLTTCRKQLRETDTFGDSLPLVASCEIGGGLLKTVKWSPDGRMVAANGAYFWTADGQRLDSGALPIVNSDTNWMHRDQPTRKPDGSSPPKIDFSSSPNVDHNWKFAWNKDGWLAGGNWYDHKVRIWDDRGRLQATKPGHRGGVESVAWSPDGMTVASAGGDAVRLWQRDGEFIREITGHTDEVYPVEWSPDGQWIATGSSDSTVRLWRPDGTAGPVFYGHQAGVFALAWSPDSTKVASASWLDNTVRVWDVKTEKTDWFALLLDAATMVPFSPTGQVRMPPSQFDTSSLLYAVEQQSGAMQLLTFKEFREQYGNKLVQVFSERFQNAAAAANLERAANAVADAATLVPDGDIAIRRDAAEIGTKLARALLVGDEFDRARQAMASVIETRKLLSSNAVGSAEPKQDLASAYSLLGWILGAAGHEADARMAFSEQIKAGEFLVADSSANDDAMDQLARGHFSRGLHTATKDEALADVGTAMQLVKDKRWIVFETVRRLDGIVRTGSLDSSASSVESELAEQKVRIVLDVFDEVLRLFPELPQAHFVGDWLVTAPAMLWNAERPLQWAQQAVDLAPEFVMARQSLMWVQFRRGEYDAALEMFDESALPNNESVFILAQLHATLGHSEVARRFLESGNAWFNGRTGYARQCADRFWQAGMLIHPTADMEARLQAEAARRIAELGAVSNGQPPDN